MQWRIPVAKPLKIKTKENVKVIANKARGGCKGKAPLQAEAFSTCLGPPVPPITHHKHLSRFVKKFLKDFWKFLKNLENFSTPEKIPNFRVHASERWHVRRRANRLEDVLMISISKVLAMSSTMSRLVLLLLFRQGHAWNVQSRFKGFITWPEDLSSASPTAMALPSGFGVVWSWSCTCTSSSLIFNCEILQVFWPLVKKIVADADQRVITSIAALRLTFIGHLLHLLDISYIYWTFVTLIGHSLHLLDICYIHWTFVTFIYWHLLHLLDKCYIYWTFVTIIWHLLHLLDICYIFWTFVTFIEQLLHYFNICYIYWTFVIFIFTFVTIIQHMLHL